MKSHWKPFGRGMQTVQATISAASNQVMSEGWLYPKRTGAYRTPGNGARILSAIQTLATNTAAATGTAASRRSALNPVNVEW